MEWLIVTAILAWLAFQGDGNPIAGVEDIGEDLYASITGRGSRLTHGTYDSTTGVITDDPDTLATTAGLTDEQYALARCLSSEEGNSSNAIKVAVCWAVINYCAKQGKTISDELTHATEPTHSGHFGSYKNVDAASSTNGKPDRYASTKLDPYTDDGQIASSCLDGTFPDPTGGAIQFDRPGGEKNPDYTATKREAAGLVVADVDGVDATVIRFWKGA
jgi:hypothetical protein